MMKIHGTSCDWVIAKVDPVAKLERIGRVFAYGSLLWNPGFPVISSTPAKVFGYKRRFWNKSADHRGTFEQCGLVVCLVEGSQTDEVCGILYEFDLALYDAIILQLDVREKYGYIRRVASALDSRSGSSLGDCWVYCACTADESIDVFLHPSNGIDNSSEEILSIASVIRSAKGPSGTNLEYLCQLVEALSILGERDPHVEAVHAAVLRIL